MDFALLNEGYSAPQIKFLSLVEMRLLHQPSHYTKKEGKKIQAEGKEPRQSKQLVLIY